MIAIPFLITGLLLAVGLYFMWVGLKKLDKKRKIHLTKQYDLILLGLHVFFFLIYVSPFNLAKPFQAFLMGSGMYVISFVLAGWVIFRFTKKQFIRAFILVFFSVLLIPLDLKAYEIRKSVLQVTIQSFYCPQSSPESGRSTILGGVHVTREGFINETHCIMTVCAEEIYSCLK